MISAMELFVQIIAVILVTAVAWIALDLVSLAGTRRDRHPARSSTPHAGDLAHHREEVHS